MSDLKSFLKQAAAGGAWDEAIKGASANSFDNPPDGLYIMQITDIKEVMSKNDKPMVRVERLILEGDLAGQKKVDFIHVAGKLGMEPLAWFFQALKMDLADIDINEIEATFAEIIARGVVQKVQLVTTTSNGNEYQNVKVKQLLPNYDASGSAAPVAAPEDDALKVDDFVNAKVNGKKVKVQVVSIGETSIVGKIGDSEFEIPAEDLLEIVR